MTSTPENEESRSTVPDDTVEQVSGGMSLRAMAPVVRASPSTVRRAAKRAIFYADDGSLQVPMVRGLDRRLRPGVRYDTSGRDVLIRQLRTEGKSIRAIAAEVGVSAGTVHRVVSRD